MSRHGTFSPIKMVLVKEIRGKFSFSSVRPSSFTIYFDYSFPVFRNKSLKVCQSEQLCPIAFGSHCIRQDETTQASREETTSRSGFVFLEKGRQPSSRQDHASLSHSKSG